MWNNVDTISTISFTTGATFFLVLTLMLAASWRGRLQGGLLVTACALSGLWAAAAALLAAYHTLPGFVIQMLEIARNALWCTFLLRLIRMGINADSTFGQFVDRLGRGLLAFSTVWCLLYLIPKAWLGGVGGEVAVNRLLFAGHIMFAVVGIMLVEQLVRNASREYRWAIKFLCLGLGGMFAYDFYYYADALLFKRVNPELWAARGGILAVIAPLIGISAARNPNWSLHVFVSRGVVFHSATLLAAGCYLLLMAAGGYYIRAYGGDWGGVAQAVFVFGAVVLLIVILFSGQLRASLRVFLAKHFFAYTYDYREEWLRFSRMLTSGESERNLRERVILSLAKMVESPGGMLLLADSDGQYVVAARWALQETTAQPCLMNAALTEFLYDRGWVVDLDEFRRFPDLYGGIVLPPDLLDIPEAWLIVPLFHHEQLLGVVILSRSRAGMRFNWEVGDLLKTAARQAASYLAQEASALALTEARQFEAYNKLATFVIHDLKNLASQLSMVVRNAERHRHNPEFVEDAFRTVGHSVDTLNHMLSQLRAGKRGSDNRRVELVNILREAVQDRAAYQPTPQLMLSLDSAVITGNHKDLVAVFCHLVQNAQEATPADGQVRVRLWQDGARILANVEDTGCGMSEEFIRTRLFKPFDTTKGASGMGIGVYETRELVKAVGGLISVQSRPGEGTTFTLSFPVLSPE
jgi:putative PEP-CTERM system histidine kinase